MARGCAGMIGHKFRGLPGECLAMLVCLLHVASGSSLPANLARRISTGRRRGRVWKHVATLSILNESIQIIL